VTVSVSEVGTSPLRRARQERGWTLEDAIFEIHAASPNGSAGVTASLLSSWERGRRRTSPRYRKILSAMYELPIAELFAHQDVVRLQAALATDTQSVRVVEGFPALLGAMIDVVAGARQMLAVAGSRSREPAYLEAIETAVAEYPHLVHHRILFGPPHHQCLVDHLGRLLFLRDPDDRSGGVKSLNIAIIDDTVATPERFFVASEIAGVIIVPSLFGAGSFDTGIVVGAPAAVGLIRHAREAYAGARRVETAAEVESLPIVG
jgi:transcriptional regulator with XRE-family HTH domain